MVRKLIQFFVIGFLAAGLSGCIPSSAVRPDQDLTELQEAYVVRDSIAIAMKGLNDARDLGKVSKAAYDKTWKIAEDADDIIANQIATAREGMVSKSALKTARAKVDEVAVVNGGVK